MCVYELSKSNVVRLEGQERGAAFVDFVKPRWLDVWDKPTTQQDFEAVKVPIHVKRERKKMKFNNLTLNATHKRNYPELCRCLVCE